MRVSLAICFLVILGAISLSTGDSSSEVQKRFLFKKKWFTTVVDKIDNVVDKTKDFVKDAAGNVKDGVVDAAKYTAKIGKKVGTGVADVSKKVIDKADDIIVDGVVDAAKWTAKTGKKVGKGVVGISKKVFHKTEDFFENRGTAVGTGVFKAGKYTIKISKKFGKGVKHVTDDVIDKAHDIIDDGVEFIIDVTDEVADGVVDAAKFTVKISKKVGKGVATISGKVYKATYMTAKATFGVIKELAGLIDFDEVVLALIDLIDSDVMNAGCQLGCVSSATSLFGPVAGAIAELACAPVCTAALAKLEDLAEDIALQFIDNDDGGR